MSAQPSRPWRRCACGQPLVKVAHDRADGQLGILLLGKRAIAFPDRLTLACRKCGKEHTIPYADLDPGALYLRAALPSA